MQSALQLRAQSIVVLALLIELVASFAKWTNFCDDTGLTDSFDYPDRTTRKVA
jgi:hypothetical protein